MADRYPRKLLRVILCGTRHRIVSRTAWSIDTLDAGPHVDEKAVSLTDFKDK